MAGYSAIFTVPRQCLMLLKMKDVKHESLILRYYLSILNHHCTKKKHTADNLTQLQIWGEFYQTDIKTCRVLGVQVRFVFSLSLLLFSH